MTVTYALPLGLVKNREDVRAQDRSEYIYSACEGRVSGSHVGPIIRLIYLMPNCEGEIRPSLGDTKDHIRQKPVVPRPHRKFMA